MRKIVLLTNAKIAGTLRGPQEGEIPVEDDAEAQELIDSGNARAAGEPEPQAAETAAEREILELEHPAPPEVEQQA